MADDAEEVLAMNRRLAEKRQHKMLEMEGSADSDKKILNAGDMTIHNHPAPPKPSTLPNLAKLALAGGLLATGIGAPVAAYMLKDALLPKAGAVFEDKEKDFGIGFFEPQEGK